MRARTMLLLGILIPACGGDDTGADGTTTTSGAPSSTTTDGPDSADTTGTAESGSESSSSSTGSMPCMGNEDCPDALAPFCEPLSGECVACDTLDDPDGGCAAEDPSMPVCVGGACVQCTAVAPEACVGTTPVCDDASNTCAPCSEHDQCGEAACNLFTGACLPSGMGNVVHAGPGQEFPTIGDAVASFDMGTEGTIIVHGNGSFDEATAVDGGRTLAFLANDGDLPRWILSGGGSPQLTIGDSTVLMDGIQVSGNASTMNPGVLVDGGRAWVDRGRIINNLGGDVVIQNAAEMVLRNCFVGGGVNDVDAVVVDSSIATVLYTTIGGGNGSFGMARALSCTGVADVSIRNSVLVAIDDVTELDCSASTVSHTATENPVMGSDNLDMGPVEVTWFSDYAAGDFHLTAPPSAIGTAAQWQDGDPAADIDGDARPGVDGLSDFAGADVP